MQALSLRRLSRIAWNIVQAERYTMEFALQSASAGQRYEGKMPLVSNGDSAVALDNFHGIADVKGFLGVGSTLR